MSNNILNCVRRGSMMSDVLIFEDTITVSASPKDSYEKHITHSLNNSVTGLASKLIGEN